METNLNAIHVFKTDVLKKKPDCPMHSTLDNHSDIQQWSIDYEDVDCVLRVVSEVLKPNEIIGIVNEFGYTCQELP